MARQNDRAAYRQGVISIVVNTLLFAGKYYAGVVSGSVALITDAWHTISDSGSSLVLIIGTRLSSKPADKEHPYGHGRIELITALIIGILLSLVGFTFLSSAIGKLLHHEAAHFGAIAISVTIASVVLNEGLAQYAFYLARQTGNTSIKADGWHHRSDALSSLIILAGILAGSRWWWIDGALGIIMAGFIFYAGYDILREVINPLIGRAPDQQMVDQVKEICRAETGMNIWPHHFHIHQYGGHTELTFHIALAGSLSLAEAHTLADRIEKAIGRQLGFETTIHVDPLEEAATHHDIAADNYR